jgi:O-antigen/teichoic acid export membrane protein
MSTTLLKSSLILAVAEFSRKALLAVTVLLCARFLSPRTFGDYIFLLSFYQIFAVLGAAGLPSNLLRAVARGRQSGMRIGFASVLARLVYIVPAALLMYVAMRLLGFADEYFSALGVLALMMVVRGAAENVAFIFQGNEDQISSAKIGVTQSAVTLLGTLAICLTSRNVLLLIGAHVIGGLASAAYGFVLLRFKGPRSQESGAAIFDETRSLLRETHWLNAGASVASAYNRIDVLLLRRLLTAEAVAIYGVPYRILDLAQIVPSSLTATILPSLCRNEDANPGTTRPRTAMRFLLVIALSLVAIVTIAAPRITLLLFGGKYRDSIPVLQILIWATVPMFWNFVLNAQLIANSFDRAIFYGACLALAVNVSLNLLLIPKFGYLACAGVTLITEFALLGANLHFVSKVGASAWPENLGRLALTSFLLATFCLSWTHAAAGYSLVATVLLILALLSMPLSRSDFTTASLADDRPQRGIATAKLPLDL